MAINARDPIATLGTPSYTITLPDGRSMRTSGALSGDLIAQAQAMGATIIPDDAVRVADTTAAENFFGDIGDAAMWAGERAAAINRTAGTSRSGLAYQSEFQGPSLAEGPGRQMPPQGAFMPPPYLERAPMSPGSLPTGPGLRDPLRFLPTQPALAGMPATASAPLSTAPVASRPLLEPPGGAGPVVAPISPESPARDMTLAPRLASLPAGAPSLPGDPGAPALATMPPERGLPGYQALGPYGLPPGLDALPPQGALATGPSDPRLMRDDPIMRGGLDVPGITDIIGAEDIGPVLRPDMPPVYDGRGYTNTGEMLPPPSIPDDYYSADYEALGGRGLGSFGGAVPGGLTVDITSGRMDVGRPTLTPDRETPPTGASGPLSPSGSALVPGGANVPGTGGAGTRAAPPPSPDVAPMMPAPPMAPDREAGGSALEPMLGGRDRYDPAQTYMDLVSQIERPEDAGLTAADIPDALLRLGLSWAYGASQPGATALGSLSGAGLNTLSWAENEEDERKAQAQAAYDAALEMAGKITELGITGRELDIDQMRADESSRHNRVMEGFRERTTRLAENADARAASRASSTGTTLRNQFGMTIEQQRLYQGAAADYEETLREGLTQNVTGADIGYTESDIDRMVAERYPYSMSAQIAARSDYADMMAEASRLDASGEWNEDAQSEWANAMADLAQSNPWLYVLFMEDMSDTGE